MTRIVRNLFVILTLGSLVACTFEGLTGEERGATTNGVNGKRDKDGGRPDVDASAGDAGAGCCVMWCGTGGGPDASASDAGAYDDRYDRDEDDDADAGAGGVYCCQWTTCGGGG